MGFVHIEPVYAKLLKSDDIILAAGVLQFLELHFEALFCFLQTLDGEALGIICSEFYQAIFNLDRKSVV